MLDLQTFIEKGVSFESCGRVCCEQSEEKESKTPFFRSSKKEPREISRLTACRFDFRNGTFVVRLYYCSSD